MFYFDHFPMKEQCTDKMGEDDGQQPAGGNTVDDGKGTLQCLLLTVELQSQHPKNRVIKEQISYIDDEIPS